MRSRCTREELYIYSIIGPDGAPSTSNAHLNLAIFGHAPVPWLGVETISWVEGRMGLGYFAKTPPRVVAMEVNPKPWWWTLVALLRNVP